MLLFSILSVSFIWAVMNSDGPNCWNETRQREVSSLLADWVSPSQNIPILAATVDQFLELTQMTEILMMTLCSLDFRSQLGSCPCPSMSGGPPYSKVHEGWSRELIDPALSYSSQEFGSKKKKTRIIVKKFLSWFCQYKILWWQVWEMFLDLDEDIKQIWNTFVNSSFNCLHSNQDDNLHGNHKMVSKGNEEETSRVWVIAKKYLGGHKNTLHLSPPSLTWYLGAVLWHSPSQKKWRARVQRRKRSFSKEKHQMSKFWLGSF